MYRKVEVHKCVPVCFSKCRTQLALNVNHESYAFIFGFNTFIALVMQSILTLVVADKQGLDLGVRTQVCIYNFFHRFELKKVDHWQDHHG